MLGFFVNMVTYPRALLQGVCTVGYSLPARATPTPACRGDPLECVRCWTANLWDCILFEDMFDMQATMFQLWADGPNRSCVRKEAFHGIRFDASGRADSKTPKGRAYRLSGPKTDARMRRCA